MGLELTNKPGVSLCLAVLCRTWPWCLGVGGTCWIWEPPDLCVCVCVCVALSVLCVCVHLCVSLFLCATVFVSVWVHSLSLAVVNAALSHTAAHSPGRGEQWLGPAAWPLSLSSSVNSIVVKSLSSLRPSLRGSGRLISCMQERRVMAAEIPPWIQRAGRQTERMGEKGEFNSYIGGGDSLILRILPSLWTPGVMLG